VVRVRVRLSSSVEERGDVTKSVPGDDDEDEEGDVGDEDDEGGEEGDAEADAAVGENIIL
jgi:hypothetical protein